VLDLLNASVRESDNSGLTVRFLAKQVTNACSHFHVVSSRNGGFALLVIMVGGIVKVRVGSRHG